MADEHLWIVYGMYDAYGDRWPILAGVWRSKDQAQHQVDRLRSIPRPFDQPRPKRNEGHIRDFKEYDFQIACVRVGQAVDEFDPEPLHQELEGR